MRSGFTSDRPTATEVEIRAIGLYLQKVEGAGVHMIVDRPTITAKMLKFIQVTRLRTSPDQTVLLS